MKADKTIYWWPRMVTRRDRWNWLGRDNHTLRTTHEAGITVWPERRGQCITARSQEITGTKLNEPRTRALCGQDRPKNDLSYTHWVIRNMPRSQSSTCVCYILLFMYRRIKFKLLPLERCTNFCTAQFSQMANSGAMMTTSLKFSVLQHFDIHYVNQKSKVELC